MEQKIIEQMGTILDLLERGFDIVIKTTKDGGVKIKYYKPKNIDSLKG